MSVRDDIVTEARTWVGTPFAHQGRVKGTEVDCAGVVYEVGKELELADFTGIERYDGYRHLPFMQLLRKVCDEYLVRIPYRELAKGDIIMMGYGRKLEGHLALYSYENRIIHASCLRGVNKCVEQTFDLRWRKRAMGYYRYPALIEVT